MVAIMGCYCKGVFLWLFLIGVTNASVELTGKWIERFGWELTCSWHTDANDSLQSVRLFRNERQFMVHRTEINGMHQEIEQISPEFRLKVSCNLGDPSGQSGRCVTNIELFRAEITKTDLYRCEVSGERPTFKLEAKEYEAFSQPSKPKVKDVTVANNQKYLNCTSEGVPVPQLVWTTEEGQKVPETFKSASWNSYKKHWLSWSTVKVEDSPLKCNAQLPLRNGTVIVATQSNAASIQLGSFLVYGLSMHLFLAYLSSSVFIR